MRRFVKWANEIVRKAGSVFAKVAARLFPLALRPFGHQTAFFRAFGWLSGTANNGPRCRLLNERDQPFQSILAVALLSAERL